MERYKNLGGDSGIRNYEIGPDYVDVQFSDGWKYRYSYQRTGRGYVDRMKVLARAGQGLNSFIMHYARYSYSRKWR